MTTEQKWIQSFIQRLDEEVRNISPYVRAVNGQKLPYAYEIAQYRNEEIDDWKDLKYETDVLIYEKQEECWKPRIIIEGKLSKITTHDAITYSQKSETHKNVHPYLRYGILIGKRRHYPLPGRLFRHGQNFDFMISWVNSDPTKEEWQNLMELINLEYKASKDTEEFLFSSRKPGRKHYTVMHKQLKLR
jgi:hypothetical protein